VVISLPGYQTLETDIDLVANKKSTIKTHLVKGGRVSDSMNQLGSEAK